MLYMTQGRILQKQNQVRELIKRALRHNVRTYCEENYQNEDKVFDKRRAVKGWKDPATKQFTDVILVI